MPRFIRTLLVANLLLLSNSIMAADIHVAAGESIQKAIDAAPLGSVISIDAGVFKGSLVIGKAITLTGAGWDKTIIQADPPSNVVSDDEKIRFADQIIATTDRQRRMMIVDAFTQSRFGPTITVKSAKDVTLRGIRVTGIAPQSANILTSAALLTFDDAQAKLMDSAVVGPFMNGIIVSNGSDIEIRGTLVAAMWGTGVAVYSGEQKDAKPSKMHLVESDIRNCYSRCVTISCEGTTIEKCRISGSAWHGIRYDNCSPTITGNLIFGNARCGIYASGSTSAIVRGNVFWKNEMDGMSCWFNNTDTIEGNTFASNLREGIAVCGDAKPKLSNNILAKNPVGIACSQINNKGAGLGDPQPRMEKNWFWKNDSDIKRLDKIEPIPDGNTQADPQFVNDAAHDFSLSADSPARQAGAGAGNLISQQRPWPVQMEEKSIVPETDTRDYTQWKKPTSNQ